MVAFGSPQGKSTEMSNGQHHGPKAPHTIHELLRSKPIGMRKYNKSLTTSC